MARFGAAVPAAVAVLLIGGCSGVGAPPPVGVIGPTGTVTVLVPASRTESSLPTTDATVPNPTTEPSASASVSQTGEVDRHDPEQIAAAFVKAFASRRAADSQADNFALRAASFATPTLTGAMMTQASSALTTQSGDLDARVTTVRRLPAQGAAGRAGYRVEFTVVRDAGEIGETTLRGAALNCSLVLGPDGAWLVAEVDYGAN